MNIDFADVQAVLEELRNEYKQGCNTDLENQDLPITEFDIVAEIRSRLRKLFAGRDLQVHGEIKLAERKKVVDITVLTDRAGTSWFMSAKAIQNRYKKGKIEARFRSVPVKFFHTAIEVKIQSKVSDAKKDIDTLSSIARQVPECNCFFVLLNARGKPRDHMVISTYANERDIAVVEYTAQV